MKNTDSTEKVQEISKKDVMRLLLDIMPNDEADIMLKTFTYNDIQRLFNEPDLLNDIFIELNKKIVSYDLLSNALKRIPSLIEEKDKLLQDFSIEHYNELSWDSKKEFCTKMMNQKELQRDLCNTLFDKMEKQIPDIKPLMDALNVRESFLILCDNI